MHQVKIFKSVETEIRGLEDEVNAWLKESGVKVINITGNIAPQSHQLGPTDSSAPFGYAPSDIVMIVLYETE